MSLLNKKEINYWEHLGRITKSLVYYLTLPPPSLLRSMEAAAMDGPDLLDPDPEPQHAMAEGTQPSSSSCFRALEVGSGVHISSTPLISLGMAGTS